MFVSADSNGSPFLFLLPPYVFFPVEPAVFSSHSNYRSQIASCEQNNHLNYRLLITDRPTEQNNHLNY